MARKLFIESKNKPSLEQLISYDTTFNIGNFYVSILIQNTDFIGNPLYPVLFLIHERNDSEYFLEYEIIITHILNHRPPL